ncbi:MAG: hypothetical protein OEY52_15670 [Gammaproteobacteria bacterium]|nr:hypothetical protein [Gammaproteobacteria bacterium]
MAFPLGTVLAAAPGIISAATDIIKLVRNRKQTDEPQQAADPRIDELAGLIEKQALLIEELAKNNNELALAVRNNRLIALMATAVAVVALLVIFLQA